MCTINYNALTAWATLGGAVATTAAVIVALGLGVFPILAARKDKLARGRNIRVQLVAVIVPIATKASAFLATNKGNYRVEGGDREDLAVLRALFPLTVLLKEQEQAKVVSLYLAICYTYMDPYIGKREMKIIADRAEAATALLKASV
jgi:hypothetical protein